MQRFVPCHDDINESLYVIFYLISILSIVIYIFLSHQQKTEIKMDPSDDMCKSLVKWLQKMITNKTRNYIEICDGVAIVDALIQMSPEYFGKLESKIKRDVSVNNWRLRISNLKKILEAVIEYFQDVLTLHVLDGGLPDVVKIGESSNLTELGKLLRLILGCAINCDKKQEYITMIMEMEETIQQNIMQTIQQLEEVTTGPGRSGLSLLIFDSDARIMKLVNDLETANKSKDALTVQIQQLEQQIQNLMDEKQELVTKNQELLILQAKNPQDAARKQIEQLKEELFRAEVMRDDFKAKLYEQEKDILGYQEKITELQLAAQDTGRLKDEVDALTESVSKVVDLELAIVSYKKRLENYQEMKKNVQKLEEKNMEYLQKNLELEEELSKSNTWKSQCDTFKMKVVELQHKLDEETQKADKAQFNLDKVKAKLMSLQGEKERLILERDGLIDENEELKLSPKKESSSAVSQELSSSDIRDKITILERENRSLKAGNQELQSKQVQLDNALSQIEKLQQKNRAQNQTILKLEAQIEELKSQSESSSNSSLIKEYRQKVISLQEALVAKENELQLSHAKYNRNVEKAREIAQLLDMKLLDIDIPMRHSGVKESEEKILATAFNKLNVTSGRLSSGQGDIPRPRTSTTRNISQRFKSK